MKIKSITIPIAIAGAFLASCESRTYAEITEVSDNPTYVVNVKPVVDAECVECHFLGGDIPPLTNYEQVRDAAENGDMLCKINGNCGDIMPPEGKMVQQTVDMINLWAQQGYVEK